MQPNKHKQAGRLRDHIHWMYTSLPAANTDNVAIQEKGRGSAHVGTRYS